MPVPQYYMEFITGYVTESAANTWTTAAIEVPTSKELTMAMIIHQVEMDIEPPEHTAVGGTVVMGYLIDDDLEDRPMFDNTHVIYAKDQALYMDAAVAEVAWASAETHILGGRVQTWQPGILYAKKKIYVGCEGVGQASAKTVRVRIGYTLEKVTTEQFIAALTE